MRIFPLAAALALCLFPACERERPLLVAGSSCMGRAMKMLAESFPAQPVEVQLGGTQLGLLALREGRCDLAACSRALTAEDTGICAVQIASDAIGVAVHPDNPLQGLTSAQLCGVFEGRLTDWRELGVAAGPIVVIGREAGSGTRTAFEELLGIKEAALDQELGESGLIRTAVASCPGAIGYLSIGYADDSVRLLQVDGALVSRDSVRTGSYPLTRPFLLCRRADDGRDCVRALLDYAASPEAGALFCKCGLFAPAGEGEDGRREPP